MRFRPCIDLHQGKVKQIVGSSLQDGNETSLQTNFASQHPSIYYAEMYRRDNLTGGHIIMLGHGNTDAASEALNAWPGGMQVGGGINADNALFWLEQGASHVIVTSYVFHDGLVDMQRLEELCRQVGKERLVLDLSCRWRDNAYYVVTDRWQCFTQVRVSADELERLSTYCDEFLVHAVDVEGKSTGIDRRLLEILADKPPLPITYAGGVASTDDLDLILTAGRGKVDVTVGSALDIFGGASLRYRDLVARYG